MCGEPWPHSGKFLVEAQRGTARFVVERGVYIVPTMVVIFSRVEMASSPSNRLPAMPCRRAQSE
jgi:hypothetical protein